MIQPYVNKLFESLPEKLKNTTTPIEIDLVLEGGAFNGSYLVGSLFFLKKWKKIILLKLKEFLVQALAHSWGFYILWIH